MMSNSKNHDEPDLINPFVLLGEFLREDGWQPERMEDEQGYQFGYLGKDGDKTGVFAWFPGETEQLIVHAYLQFQVPQEKRNEIAEFITRANYGLPAGNFEMDFDSGEIRAKCSVDFEGIILVPILVKNILYTVLLLVDEYMPGFKAVLDDDKSPREAIDLIENNL